jgi:flagella basal body P-ring formation protein FlgA
MKSISLAGRHQFWTGIMAVAMVAMPAHASDTISGAELKDHIQSVLAARGLDSTPVIADKRQFLACDAPWQVTPMFGGYKTVRLSCPDQDGFEIAVRTQLDKALDEIRPALPGALATYVPEKEPSQLVIVTRSIQRGAVISADDVALVTRTGNVGMSYYSDVDDVIGRKAKRAISINQTIRSRHLELDWTIKKDQDVSIETTIGPVTVVSAGTALANAQMGELVKVKNTSSDLVVEGIVMSEKKIRIRAK